MRRRESGPARPARPARHDPPDAATGHGPAPAPARRRLLAAASAAATATVAAGWTRSAVAAGATPGEVSVGQPLREATLRGLNGPSRQLSSFRGRPLVINVWASWCGPCVAEMGSLERLAWHDALGDVAVIGISTDDYPDRAQALLRRINATIPHYIDQRLELENMLGASSIPLTVLVDARGHVAEKVYGAQRWDSPQALSLIRQRLKPGAVGRRA